MVNRCDSEAPLGRTADAILFERLQIDLAAFDRPEAAAAGLIAQVSVLIGGADEDALARLDDFAPAIARTVALSGPRNERLKQRSLGLAHRVHFGDFDEPFAAQVLRYVFAAGHLRQRIGKPFASEPTAGG